MKKACLVFIIKNNLGGAERRLTRAFDAIDNMIIDILIWDRSHNLDFFNEISNYRIINHSCIIRKKNPISFCYHILKENYNWVCYFDCTGTLPIIPILAKISGAKRLWIIASTIYANIDNASIRNKILFKMFSYYASRIDCLYPSRVEYLKSKFSHIKCTATPIPFTDPNLFYPKEKKNLIVFLGRMIPIKHPMEAVMAVFQVKEFLRKNKYKVIIGGSGILLDKVRDYVNENNISDIVDIPGYVDSSKLLTNAKIFLSLQDFNNYPSQALIEAISCGCWCIATDVGETSLLIKEEFGDLIDLNVNSIAQALVKAVHKCEKMDFIESEIQFAKENFNIQNSIKYYSDIINE